MSCFTLAKLGDGLDESITVMVRDNKTKQLIIYGRPLTKGTKHHNQYVLSSSTPPSIHYAEYLLCTLYTVDSMVTVRQVVNCVCIVVMVRGVMEALCGEEIRQGRVK